MLPADLPWHLVEHSMLLRCSSHSRKAFVASAPQGPSSFARPCLDCSACLLIIRAWFFVVRAFPPGDRTNYIKIQPYGSISLRRVCSSLSNCSSAPLCDSFFVSWCTMYQAAGWLCLDSLCNVIALISPNMSLCYSSPPPPACLSSPRLLVRMPEGPRN